MLADPAIGLMVLALIPQTTPPYWRCRYQSEYLRQAYQMDITSFKYRVANPQNEVVISTHNYNICIQTKDFIYFTLHVTLWFETHF